MASSIEGEAARLRTDRKSTRLNSSHLGISYAVFCLKKKKSRVNVIRGVRSLSHARRAVGGGRSRAKCAEWQSGVAPCASSTRVCVNAFFFFNDTATTEIYTLSLHDALPI